MLCRLVVTNRGFLKNLLLPLRDIRTQDIHLYVCTYLSNYTALSLRRRFYFYNHRYEAPQWELCDSGEIQSTQLDDNDDDGDYDDGDGDDNNDNLV